MRRRHRQALTLQLVGESTRDSTYGQVLVADERRWDGLDDVQAWRFGARILGTYDRIVAEHLQSRSRAEIIGHDLPKEIRQIVALEHFEQHRPVLGSDRQGSVPAHRGARSVRDIRHVQNPTTRNISRSRRSV